MLTTLRSTSRFAQHLNRTLTQQCARSMHVSQTFGRGWYIFKTGSSSTTERRRFCWCVPLTCAQNSLSCTSRWTSLVLCRWILSETLGHFLIRIWTCNITSSSSALKPASNSGILAGYVTCSNAKTTEMLVHVYMTLRLDCGNALLHGVPEALLRQLQSVQNIAAHSHQSGQAGTQQRPARAAALAACQFPGGLQNPPPNLPCLAWSGASVPLSAADCLQTYQEPLLPFPATAAPAQEQTKDVWRPGFLSRCTMPLECMPWRLQDKPEDLPP